MKKIIMFDVDGVLADFDRAFTTVGNRLFGTPICDTEHQPEWNFRRWMSSAQQDACWVYLKSFTNWWSTLKPLIDKGTFQRINMLTWTQDVYFVTNRMHDVHPPSVQTADWLRFHGVEYPNVIVTPKKGEAAKVISATHAIEDNWGNACAIHWMSDAKTFLIRRLYNEEARQIIPGNIQQVGDVSEFLDRVQND